MATRQGTLIIGEDGVARARWTGITEADQGSAVGGLSGYPDRSVQVVGDFTTSGAITLEGSNDGGTSWSTLNDFEGDALVITTTDIRLIAENPDLIRPRATAGSSVSMDVYIVGMR